MAKFKPVVDADQVYGEGDWRPILGDAPRKSDWKLHMIGKQSIEDRLRGVILPSFDFELDTEDKAFQMSVGACWTNETDPKQQRHFLPNGWGIPITMYPYMGERKEHWISPHNRKNMIGNTDLDPEDAMDAFDDLNKWVRRNKGFNDSQKDYFLKTKKLSDDPLVPGRTVRFFSLAECRDKENNWHNAVLGYTASSYSFVIEQLRWRHEDDGEPRDPNWPRYLLGDPTDPASALVWHVDKVQLDPKDTHDTNVLCYTKRREFLDEDQEIRKISPETLAKRFLMVDPSNWNIPTYEEQVMHMIEHYAPEVTAEMIRAACGHRCRVEIPERSKNRMISTPAGRGGDAATESRSRTNRDDAATETRDSEEDRPARSMAPTGGSKPPIPTDAPDSTVDVSREYFTGKPGEKPAKRSVSELQEMVNSGDATGVKVHMDGAWVKLEDSGLTTPPPAAEEEPPPFDDVPDDVPGDVPDEVPDDVPSDVPAEGAVTKAELRDKLFPDKEQYDAFSAELRKKADDLIDEAFEATEQGKYPEKLPPELIDRMLEIVG